MQEKKRFLFFCFKTKIPFNAATLSFSCTPQANKQSIPSISTGRETERERACLNDYEKWIQQTTNSIYNSLLPPLHIPQKSKSPSPEENGRSNIHACTPKKRKWETKQKKISKETQNVLWCFPSKDPKHTDCYQEQWRHSRDNKIQG
jgi:hypothetical protein